MLSATLQQGLKAYGIGPKIRAIRLKKKMGLVELGRHTGLSAAMLSKIERGQLFPTLPTLLRIALVFSVGLDYFFVQEREKPIVGVARHKERLRFPERPGTRDVAYEFESLDFPAVQRLLNSYFAEFFQIAPVVNYPNEHEYTRVTEFKYLTGQQHPKTSVVYEYPRAEGDPYYPVPRPENAALYKQYQALAEATPNVHFVGRLATYKYYNMDQVVAQALATVAKMYKTRRLDLTREAAPPPTQILAPEIKLAV